MVKVAEGKFYPKNPNDTDNIILPGSLLYILQKTIKKRL